VPASRITPVTVLTGFLGSGKTTLLQRIVEDPRYADIAMLTGEWDEMPATSCLCCRVAGDLVQTLRELHFKRAEGSVPDFPQVVIETTGLADPAPLLATLAELPLVAVRYSPAGVVAAVEAEHGLRTLDEHPEAVRQAAIADLLVITKCDLVSSAAIDALETRLASLNPAAPRLRSANASVDPAELLASRRPRGTAHAVSFGTSAGLFRA
jgi:G3E family GTPase